ncbi:partner and localizer of BRCA2 isoform 3-T3 [Porphyrio hochstetteri]
MGTQRSRAARFPRETTMEGPAAEEEPEAEGEAAAGGALSGAQKEKLRAKLALLRREYSETVSRLRRARRAERARSHGWGTTAEGGRRERSPAGSRDNVSPSADKHEPSQLQTKPCSDPDTDEKTSVAFKHIPEFTNNEANLPASSQAEGMQASQQSPCCGIVRSPPEEKTPQTSRSLMKLRRRTKALVSEDRESVRDVHLINAQERVENPITSREELGSPVFRRSSLLNAEENAQRASRPAHVQGIEKSFTPPDAALGVVQDVLEDSVPPGGPEPVPCALMDSSDAWQPESPSAVAMSDNCEPARPCPENGDSVLLDTSGDGGKESSTITKQMQDESMCEDQGELHQLLDFMSANEVLPAEGNNAATNEGKSHEGSGGDTNSLNPFPTELALGSVEELLEPQQVESQSRLFHPDRVTAPESSLNSCTVVDGLLFPVEYYVRTTRRMSNCQRKVDLDAVILSQLGRSKKGQRNESKRGHSYPAGSEGSASLGLPAMDPDMCNSLFSFHSLQWLAPRLGISDFDLPDEEFGLLKLEKLESSPVNDLEVFVPSVDGDGVASEHTQVTQMNPEIKSLRTNSILPFKNTPAKLPHLESPPSKKELSTHELLFTPTGPVLAAAPTQPESQISSSVFPVVGATPAVSPLVCGEVVPSTPSVPPSQAQPPSKGASAQVVDGGEHKESAFPLHSDSCGAGSARKEEEQGTTFPLEAERGPDSKSDEAVSLEKHWQSESKQQRSCRGSPEQKKAVAAQLTPVLLDDPREESLQLVSKLKDSSSSCAVDVSTVWWEAAGSRELCVVTACESSVSLWKPQASDCWAKVYTWQLGEIPVIQIVPLPDACNLVCIALGDLEIGEIRLLLYSSENDSFKQSLVKTGNIKAVLGLKDRRLVSSSRTVQEQQVEVLSLSETERSKDGQTLMAPEETVLAFAEVEDMRDALVGTTVVNSIVIWNVKTGQLLKKMHVGYSYPASICHRAYSDSGLLFIVLSHPHAKESESCGNPAFRVIAFNPKTARSTGVMFSSLPPGHSGRYLEGDVKDASAAAVLTSGAIAVWDLLLGHCTALLPPGPEGNWALTRWATSSACLLAGQRDGTVCLYRYRQPQPGAA